MRMLLDHETQIDYRIVDRVVSRRSRTLNQNEGRLLRIHTFEVENTTSMKIIEFEILEELYLITEMSYI